MKIKTTHKNGDVSLRMDNNTFYEFMNHLVDCENLPVELKIIHDSIVDEENES